ncbi:hypothetical protein DM01DRAFT_1379570 [Hesseltinella vesiculosa]|uniref:S-adenosyl-L-methionine-dependent methyltransferase n=1 Tax=Hesseltinella vesiculosa TaxID=101127 RepID=A0A1X2GZA7_9FUNG|nr:hypothetical protein DM01DRAFT_1379570 [Hesseltinella vesiculosa]
MDDHDFVVGNRPQGLNVQASHGPPAGISVGHAMSLKQDVVQLGLAGKVWESAYILQSYFSSQQHNALEPSQPIPVDYYAGMDANATSSRRYRVLELGSGVGYGGLALANELNQHCQVYLTDLEPVVPTMSENAKAHLANDGLHAEVVCTRLHWGNKADAARVLDDGPIDLVLISDCVYFVELFSILMDTLLEVCSEQTKVVIGYKCRSLEKEVGFWDYHFGRHFDYEPVLNKDGSFFGYEQDCYVFVGQRRPADQVRPTADDRFALTMLNNMGMDIFD